MEDHLTIRGSLEESALPELLRSVYKSRESGVLTCFIEDYRKSIYIHDGQIIFASSTNFDDRLGESLIRYGKITIRMPPRACDRISVWARSYVNMDIYRPKN
jgi:hypothetical protein